MHTACTQHAHSILHPAWPEGSAQSPARLGELCHCCRRAAAQTSTKRRACSLCTTPVPMQHCATYQQAVSHPASSFPELYGPCRRRARKLQRARPKRHNKRCMCSKKSSTACGAQRRTRTARVRRCRRTPHTSRGGWRMPCGQLCRLTHARVRWGPASWCGNGTRRWRRQRRRSRAQAHWRCVPKLQLEFVSFSYFFCIVAEITAASAQSRHGRRQRAWCRHTELASCFAFCTSSV